MNQTGKPGPAVLAGVKVVEIGQILAGPFAGAILADLGAEVVKVERPGSGDDGRAMGRAFRYGDSLVFHEFNRGKHSVEIDLKSEEGRADLERLVAEADILVHNLRPGVPESLGIDAETLTARYPRLIYCEISAFGHVGPLRLRPGYEPLLQAYSGLSSINGGADDPPMRTGASICDQGSAMWAVIGVLSLLHRRAETGKGGVIRTSLLETSLVWSGQKIDAFVNEGRAPERHRSGHPGLVPYEAFTARDGDIVISIGNDRLFARFAEEMGRPDWATDARYRTNRDRIANHDALIAEIGAIVATANRQDWVDRLSAVGVPCAAVHTIPEALAEPQVAAQEMLLDVPGEDFRLIGLPVTFEGERPPIRFGAPRVGADNGKFGIGKKA